MKFAINESRDELMTSTQFDTEYVVFGLGKTGLSVARFLRNLDIPFSVVDTRDHPPGLEILRSQFSDVNIIPGEPPSEVLGCCKVLVLSPGVPRSHPFVVAALGRGIEVIGDIELFARHANAPVVAVTGSNGKSTVVTMVAGILAEAGRDVRSGGNLGTPALDLLSDQAAPDFYIIELSSFQLESTSSLAPVVACILNISPDHLDRYADLSSYAAAKLRILDRAQCAVLCAEDSILADLKPNCDVRHFGSTDGSGSTYCIEDTDGGAWLFVENLRLMRADALRVHGEHNYLNALAAIAITDVLSVPKSAQTKALREFSGLPHRCQTIASRSNVDWIDDSKGTNVGASCAAISAVFADRHGVLIAGGQAKDADFSAFRLSVQKRVRAVVLIGQDANKLASALEGVTEIYFAIDMSAAVAIAARLALPGEAVLLSPACASLDMFENFEARGLKFADAVHGLSQS
jgi:UDP-N-acetylmuramoylalanine--D-glutamate ligase